MRSTRPGRLRRSENDLAASLSWSLVLGAVSRDGVAADSESSLLPPLIACISDDDDDDDDDDDGSDRTPERARRIDVGGSPRSSPFVSESGCVGLAGIRTLPGESKNGLGGASGLRLRDALRRERRGIIACSTSVSSCSGTSPVAVDPSAAARSGNLAVRDCRKLGERGEGFDGRAACTMRCCWCCWCCRC
jgi:hypothetical protein